MSGAARIIAGRGLDAVWPQGLGLAAWPKVRPGATARNVRLLQSISVKHFRPFVAGVFDQAPDRPDFVGAGVWPPHDSHQHLRERIGTEPVVESARIGCRGLRLSACSLHSGAPTPPGWESALNLGVPSRAGRPRSGWFARHQQKATTRIAAFGRSLLRPSPAGRYSCVPWGANLPFPPNQATGRLNALS